MKGELVSIIVPVHNFEAQIGETLNSVLSQTYENWECIVVDDGSTDRSAHVIAECVGEDQRFTLICTKNEGVCAARNTAVGASRGYYVFPLDGDDKIHPECIARCVKAFEERPGSRLAYPQGELFGGGSGKWELPDFDYLTMLKYNMVHNSSLFLRKDFDRVGGYRMNMVYGLEDWDFFIALLHGCSGEEVVQIREPLFFYRVRDNGRRLTVAGAEARQMEMMDLIIYNNFQIYREYFPGIFERIHAYDFDKTLLNKPLVKFAKNLLIRLSVLKGRLYGNKNGFKS
jgi:glycosyltransferase involved in cell wall biosynthesis